MHTLTRILHSDSLKKMMTMNLPKPRPQLQALQAKLDSLRNSRKQKILDFTSKPKNSLLNKDLEEDVYNSDDFFSED